MRYLWALFEVLRWRLKQEIDRRAGAAGPSVVRRELSLKAKLSIYWLIYIPCFICDPELWVVTRK